MSADFMITAEMVHLLQETLDKAAQGIRDPEEMDLALKEMERMREELRQRIGTVDLALELVHDARNQ